jgi:hypothetical protein
VEKVKTQYAVSIVATILFISFIALVSTSENTTANSQVTYSYINDSNSVAIGENLSVNVLDGLIQDPNLSTFLSILRQSQYKDSIKSLLSTHTIFAVNNQLITKLGVNTSNIGKYIFPEYLDRATTGEYDEIEYVRPLVGKSVGLIYDPATNKLILNGQYKLTHKGDYANGVIYIMTE